MTEDLERLVAVCENPAEPLTARLSAATRLGELGDSRLLREPVRVGAIRFSRYPATNADYARYRVKTSATPPRFQDDQKWSHLQTANQPVVGITFEEAAAYARWAGGRLPTELEWAIGAGAPFRYPWGETWLEDAACCRGTLALRAPPPVGCFPRGVSPHGLWDCAGTVWEWCAPDDLQSELRPVRGGAWNSLPASCGVEARNEYRANDRWSNVGMRVVFD